jgi:hypothetical protein
VLKILLAFLIGVWKLGIKRKRWRSAVSENDEPDYRYLLKNINLKVFILPAGD